MGTPHVEAYENPNAWLILANYLVTYDLVLNNRVGCQFDMKHKTQINWATYYFNDKKTYIQIPIYIFTT